MKNFALISLLGTCFVACSGNDPTAGGPTTAVTDGGDEPKRDTTVTTDPSCPKKGDVDDLDAAGTDDNCDGIDGVLADTVFVVAGAPETGKGIPADPVGSIAKAAEIAKAASKHHVYVCIGTVTEAVEIVAPADLHVHGGFACDRNWRRIGADPRTTWTSASAEALRITGGAKVSFDHFDITAGDAVEAGGSSVAVALSGVADVQLSNVSLTAGNGADGLAGVAGAPLAPRGKSASGSPAWGESQALGRPQDCTLPGGPTSYAGTGGTALARIRQNGDSGGSSSDGTDGGDWRLVWTGDSATLSSAFAVGSDGAHGAPGADAAPAPALGSLVEARYVASVGSAGALGTNGRSGGGGAPGQGVEVCWGRPGSWAGTWVCDTPVRGWIQGGGAGGAGGCFGAGGAGGAAGGSGGASIALLSSLSTVALQHVILRTKSGGAGGSGALGTAGQLGGAGGSGGSGSDKDGQSPELGARYNDPRANMGYSGFRGGNGGNGGAGGAGSAGAGGPSVALYVVGPAPVVDATVTYEVGTGGSGGAAVGGGQRGVDGPSERSVTQ